MRRPRYAGMRWLLLIVLAAALIWVAIQLWQTFFLSGG